MEDLQNSSLEEKVDLDTLVLCSSDLYSNMEINKFNNSIEKEKCKDDSDIIDNSAHNNVKSEKVELSEQDSDTNDFESSTNGAELCRICGLEFGNKTVLKIHNSIVHPEGNKGDKDKDYLKQDESVNEGVKQYKCQTCKYETRQKSGLKRHIKCVHEGIKPFDCIICDFKTAQQYALKKHIEFVHEGIKPFQCKICDYKATRKSGLKQHMIIKHHKMHI